MANENEILSFISAMRDSVWVINTELQKQPITKQIVETVLRNVQHLEHMMNKTEIVNSGENLIDIAEAINVGNTFVETNKSLLE
jgi:hypothetical protein